MIKCDLHSVEKPDQLIFSVEMKSYITHDYTCMQISCSITLPFLFAFL